MINKLLTYIKYNKKTLINALFVIIVIILAILALKNL